MPRGFNKTHLNCLVWLIKPSFSNFFFQAVINLGPSEFTFFSWPQWGLVEQEHLSVSGNLGRENSIVGGGALCFSDPRRPVGRSLPLLLTRLA